MKPGKTYGEDAIVVVMSLTDYTNKYIPICRGEKEVSYDMADMDTDLTPSVNPEPAGP